jgi:DNA helicase HerA-like ATPase
MKASPFNHNYFLGYVREVQPQYIRIHFPSSTLLNSFIHDSEEFNGGMLGNFVVIEGERYGFIGRILDLTLPEGERKELSERDFEQEKSVFHPSGRVELLLAFDTYNPENVTKSIGVYPSIGSKVYVSSKSFLQSYVKDFGVKKENKANEPLIQLGKLTSNGARIEVSQNALFGRHCAVVGTTGGGKSWTVAKLIQDVQKSNAKIILIDATGEYAYFKNQRETTETIEFGTDSGGFLHYSNLTIYDIFSILKPSEQTQKPKLLDAIRSLKLCDIILKDSQSTFLKLGNDEYKYKNLDPLKIDNGVLIKELRKKKPISVISGEFSELIDGSFLNIDIKNLEAQIVKECVFESSKDFKNNTEDPSIWGSIDKSTVGHCTSLIVRIRSLLNNRYFKNSFGFDKPIKNPNEFSTILNNFLSDDKKSLLYIDFKSVGYEFQIREILTNAIGNKLLGLARDGKFKKSPSICFIDEAHQFLNKKIKDEFFETIELNAFDQIAKECRKYGLFLCLATQMPRDIPQGTLSQMGTFIVHRLINENDKKTVESACASANRDVLAYMPVLGEGEALLLGVDFPMPLTIKIDKPDTPPDSQTPRFQKMVRNTESNAKQKVN